MQACKLTLPHTRPSLEVTSLLSDPISNTLALMHTDSSILLLPSLSPFSLSSPPPSFHSQTLIPPFCTSSCFLRLQSTPNSSTARVVFVVAGPRHGESRVLLRLWILHKNNVFVKAKVVCSQSCFVIDEKIGVGVLLNGLDHGVSVNLVGDVNFFVLHSISARKIWFFSAKMVGVDDCVKLMKCAVIDCTIPICSITVSFGVLVLGEANGVRVFSLRSILNGGMKKQRGSAGAGRKDKKKNGLRNCGACSRNEVCSLRGGGDDKNRYSKGVENHHSGIVTALRGSAEISFNGCVGKLEMNDTSSKLRTVKLKQDSTGGSTFVAFKSPDVGCQKPLILLQAVSVHSLSPKKFLVLDSDGNLHLLSLYIKTPGSEVTGHMSRLNHTMKVRMLAVLPDLSTRAQTFWISDGFNSVHVMSICDTEASLNANEKIESEEKQMQITGIQAMFASEKVQDLIPLSPNAVLILGQGSIFAYAIS